jgi:LysM repeat protein
MKNWMTIVFLLLSVQLFAQPKDAVIEEVDGKKYYVHIVQSGNSLWGIHVLYNTPVDDIVTMNPGVENGIKDGQKLLIPVIEKKSNSTTNNPSGALNQTTTVVTHKVLPQETLYGISKKYGVTIEQINATNPSTVNGLKLGQELIIPNQVGGNSNSSNVNTVPPVRIVFSDTIINHEVLAHETIYSISKRFMVPVEDIKAVSELKSNKIKPGDIIRIPIKNEKVQKVEVREVKQIEIRDIDTTLIFKRKDEYSIAILLPFFLEKGAGYSENVSNLATEFYMGAKLAIDSLDRLGLKAKVYVYDSQNDTLTIKSILKKPEFKTMDLVIGPLFPDKMGVVARWCKEKKVKFVCPVASNTDILKENPFVYAAIPSDATLIEGAAKYLLNRNPKEQIVLVKPVTEKDIVLYDRFRSSFMSLPYSGTRPKLIESNLTDYKTFIKKGANTTFVIPSTDEVTSKKFMNSLISASNNVTGTITVFGTKDWLAFEDINGAYKNKYNFHFSSPNDFNYTYEETKLLNKVYRKTYNADMTKMSVQGFDVLLFFSLKYLLNQDPNFGIMSDFNMVQKGTGNGFENNNSFILKQQDFEIVKIAETNE